MAQRITPTTPTAAMVATLRAHGYYALTTFATSHNVHAREIRLYTNGTITVLLHVYKDWNCDLYLPAKGTTMPLSECDECPCPKSRFGDNPACAQEKSPEGIAAMRTSEDRCSAQHVAKGRQRAPAAYPSGHGR